MFATRRLPGVQIDATPPTAVQTLPRMDVAVLVGFASTGPLHVPVAIEGVGQYTAVFGVDASLAWDAQRSERVMAYLGPAVRAFFANGGRRCWVIRVARSIATEALWRGVSPQEARSLPDVARCGRFAIPGVLAANPALAPAMAQARCEGSWSDNVQTSAALSTQSFAIDKLGAADSPSAQHFTLRTRFGLRVGDLLQFGDTRGICAYAVVGGVAAAASPGGPLEVDVSLSAAFERITDNESPGSPALPGTLTITGFADAVSATRPAATQIVADTALPVSLQAGHWARWQDSNETMWLRIDDIERRPTLVGSPAIDDPSVMDATLSGAAWRELGAMLPLALIGELRAQVLTLDLRAQREGDNARLAGMGLTPAHATPWWAQRTDAEFYAPRDEARADGSAPAPQPPSDAVHFALAHDDTALPLAWLPLGVEPLFGAATGALPQVPTPLQRDGLSRFDAELFLDPELATTGVATLIAQADTIRLMRDPPRPLFGLHAAASIGTGGIFNEATLLAMPDAVHIGWEPLGIEHIRAPNPQGPPTPAHWRQHRGACAMPVSEPLDGPDFGAFIDCASRVLPAPFLSGPSAPVQPGAYRLNWGLSSPDSSYVLVEATQPDSSDAREIYRGTATSFNTVTRREGSYLYQVFAEVGDDRSDGSNAVVVLVRGSDWRQVDANTLPPEFEQQWIAIHRAALRLSAACGELFTVLAMPRHFHTAQALRYAMRLRAVKQPRPLGSIDPQAFGHDEARALSYGALFHPWLQTNLGAPRLSLGNDGPMITGTMTGTPRIVPPDGSALGLLAGRASRRGAWIAPANEPLNDVVALSRQVPSTDWQALQDARINLLRADPRGLLCLSADTLSLDVDVRPINVRRLLILLRRLALRRGNTYVFEPNGPVLRRAVQRSFTEMLTDMFRRGAFAGTTPEQSFRVVTDNTLNTSRDVAEGRFMVELRVAPALPMRFISVRLSQTGERLTVAEEL